MYYKCGVATKLEAIEAAMRVSRRILHIFHCDTCDSFYCFFHHALHLRLDYSRIDFGYSWINGL